MIASREKLLHWFYEIGIWFKGIDGILEVIGGILVLMVTKTAINRFVVLLTQHELVEDPTDWIALHLRHAVSHLSANTRIFAGAYLLGHGAVKVFLVWGGLWRCKLWAFPTALAFLGALILYQSYRLGHRFSFGLMGLIIVDFMVMLLIWHEYTVLKKRHDRSLA